MFHKGARFNAYKRVDIQGISFASKLEAALYQQLQLEELAKEIEILKIQDTLYLSEARICYRADFKIKNLKTGEVEWAEAKGFEGDRWPIIKKLWKAYGPGKLKIYKGTYRKLKLVEEILPGQSMDVFDEEG